MARNKARRPGAPPESASGSDGPLARPEATVEGDADAAPPPPGAAVEPSGAPASDAAEGSTGAAGAEWRVSPAPAEAVGATGAGERHTAGGASAGAEPPDPAWKRDAPPKSYRSWLAGIIGGLIGGGLVALATYLLPQQPPEVTDVRGELDQLRQDVAETGRLGSEDLLGRLEAVEAAVAGAQTLPQRLQAVEGTGASLGQRIAAVEEQLAAVEGQVETIETGAAGGVAPERVATLEGDLATLEATVAGLQGAVPSSGAAGGQDLADLASRIGALEQQSAAGQQETTGLTDDIVSLSGQVGALSTRVDALAEGLDKLQQRIASTEERRTQVATLARTVAQLDAALERGGPFQDLLDGLRSQEDAVVLEATAQLEPVAGSGVPSLAALRSSFDPAANQIVHAAQAPEGDGLLQQAAGNLMSLVTVRPVGAEVEGDSAAARVARAEAALEGGDVAAAVAELEALDGPAAQAAAPWLAEARPRLAAETALHTLRERATLLVERP